MNNNNNNNGNAIDPMMLGTSLSGDDGDPADFESMNRAALLAWEERQRRQRTLRSLMMLLMFLLLMDGEEPQDRRNARLRQQRLRAQNRNGGSVGGADSYKVGMYFDEDGNDLTPLQDSVYQRRKMQDTIIRKALTDNQSSKHYDLIELNNGRDFEAELTQLLQVKLSEEMVATDENDNTNNNSSSGSNGEGRGNDEDTKTTDNAAKDKETQQQQNQKQKQQEEEPNDELQVYHYPRNATGYYRGVWKRIPKEYNTTTKEEMTLIKSKDHDATTEEQIYPWMKQELAKRKLDAGVLVLPPDVQFKVVLDDNSTTAVGNDGSNTLSSNNNNVGKKSRVSLTKEDGRMAIQLYSHPIPAMNEISVVDGLVKLFDGSSSGFVSRQTDVLLRVRGVMIHGIGKMSLVTTFPSDDDDDQIDQKARGSYKRSVFGVRQVGNNYEDTQLEQQPSKGEGVKSSLLTSTKMKDEYFVEETPVLHHADNIEDATHNNIDDDDEAEVERQRRRLQATVDEVIDSQKRSEKTQDDNDENHPRTVLEMMTQIREEVMTLYSFHYDHSILDQQYMSPAAMKNKMESSGWTQIQTIDEEHDIFGHEYFNGGPSIDNHSSRRRLQAVDDSASSTNSVATEKNNTSIEYILYGDDTEEVEITATMQRTLALSATPPVTVAQKHAYRFPYTIDDKFSSVERAALPVLNQKLPMRDQILEDNAGKCEFNMDLDVQTVMWTYGDWRKSMDHRFRMEEAFNPYTRLSKASQTNAELLKRLKKDPHFILVNKQVQLLEEEIPQESWVVTLSGNIESTNCEFASFVNVTAMRTNWEKTTAKAINYSFYMMIACLTQIVVLLRQLLHTQAHSVASNVSLLCIGWQTVLDAMLCISHIFLCLILQPLFTAFASVAFFKLLIFCVIEMKYMAIIIQARNSVNNTGATQEQLRHQITVLHLKFYAALMLSITLFWYVGQSCKTLYMMALYSFWVPQICWNIYSEYKKPMHPQYIYGMSLTRAVAPLYVFAVKNNFLKEVNPEFPTDTGMCEMLILWIFLQAAILVGQSKYGTRFMIPQRFLPPKFDYSRPIPAALLPRPSSNSSNESTASDIELDPTTAGSGTRNRRGGGNRGLADGTESMSEDTGEECTLDCVICYNEIDVTDSKGYMLAPCDHIFHRECLEQWMDVKVSNSASLTLLFSKLELT